MNLLLVGGTREPVRMLQYLRLLTATNQDAEALLKVSMSREGVRTAAHTDHLQYVHSIFVLQNCGGIQFAYLHETWGGVFVERPLADGEEIGDIVWMVDWKTLFGTIDDVLRKATLHQDKGGFGGVNAHIANGALSLLVQTFPGANIFFEDFALARQGDSRMLKRCGQCVRFCGDGPTRGQCAHFPYLTGDERICSKFKPQEPV